jgi:hypothetical protein
LRARRANTGAEQVMGQRGTSGMPQRGQQRFDRSCSAAEHSRGDCGHGGTMQHLRTSASDSWPGVQVGSDGAGGGQALQNELGA